MTNRYEDTTPFERDVMTSMGYHWKGEGWQKASDNGETMVVTGWTGDIPADSSRITHIWDQNIADMNTSPILYGMMPMMAGCIRWMEKSERNRRQGGTISWCSG